jgi:LmbE family N-acetylglucosaminyl deacetylase
MTQTATTPIDLWSPDDGIERVLVVTAHPDDVDFGAAGSVAALRAAGVEVAYCIVTSGEAGGSDLTMARTEMAAIRQREQRAAAAAVGVDDVTFLGYPDGALESSMDLRRDISRVIRTFRPGRVITQSPDRLWESIFASHPDHLAAGEAAMCAVYPDARNPFAHPELLSVEGLEPHSVSEVWLMAAGGSTRAVDITDTFEQKMSALRCHKSQGTDNDEMDERIRAWGTANAAAAGRPEGTLAELFRVVITG